MKKPKYAVKSGDTLSAIANHFYGDPSLSSALAAVNKIANPNVIPVGKVLQIPDLPDHTDEFYQSEFADFSAAGPVTVKLLLALPPGMRAVIEYVSGGYEATGAVLGAAYIGSGTVHFANGGAFPWIRCGAVADIVNETSSFAFNHPYRMYVDASQDLEITVDARILKPGGHGTVEFWVRGFKTLSPDYIPP
jgi:LysM repeat protein